jgi:hypothetical protein
MSSRSVADVSSRRATTRGRLVGEVSGTSGSRAVRSFVDARERANRPGRPERAARRRLDSPARRRILARS